MSRTAAVKEAAGRRIDKELESRGVIARAQSRRGLAERGQIGPQQGSVQPARPAVAGTKQRAADVDMAALDGSL